MEAPLAIGAFSQFLGALGLFLTGVVGVLCFDTVYKVGGLAGWWPVMADALSRIAPQPLLCRWERPVWLEPRRMVSVCGGCAAVSLRRD
jgi:hypothetical protein